MTPVAAPAGAPLDVLLCEHRTWMCQDRGLAATAMLRYANTAPRFLAQQAMAGGVLEPAELADTDVNAFLSRECARVWAG